MQNKGFTLIELLAVMFVFSISVTLTLHDTRLSSDRYEKFLIISEYSKIQNDAMINRLNTDYINSDVYSEYDIYFNGRGDTNIAQTVNVKDKYELIVSLGSGRLYEKEE